MGFFSRALDVVDNAITDTVKGTRVRHQYSKGADEFARQVRPGDVYYSEETVQAVTGDDVVLLQEHRADGRGKFGHLSAKGLYLAAGTLHRDRPAGMKTFEEYSEQEVAGPDAGKAVEQPKRGIFGGRRAA
jgi:hypothetical protein